jgi:hypothetical protein
MGSMTGFYRRCTAVNNPSALYPVGELPRGVARSSLARLTAASTREPGGSPGFRFTWDGGL